MDWLNTWGSVGFRNGDMCCHNLTFAKSGNLLADVVTGRVTSKAGVGMLLAKDQLSLSNHQLSLLGLKPKVNHIVPDSSTKPPKSKVDLTPTSEDLVPLHQPITGSGSVLSSRTSIEQLSLVMVPLNSSEFINTLTSLVNDQVIPI